MSDEMSPIEVRLEELGLALPNPAAPLAAYVPAKVAGGLLYVSGQLPSRFGEIETGTLGECTSIEEGYAAARLCGLMLLAQAHQAVGLSRISGCVQLTGFVACVRGFHDQAKVINGASELMQDVMGEAGRHTRAAVGAPALPLGACVEIAGVFSLTA